MILDKYIKIVIGGRNIKYYKSIGYSDLKIGGILKVPIEKLYKTTRKPISVKCDYCGKAIKKVYRTLMKERISSPIKKDCCLKCSPLKRKEYHLLLYGVENTLQRKETKNKIRETNIKKYGFPFVSQNKKIKDKVKKTFDAKSPKEKKEIRNKIKKTTIERYGVESSLQMEKTRRRLLETMNKGSSQQKKIYEILLEKYGRNSVYINYPFSKLSLDIFIVKDNVKLDVEYDSSYWHTPKGDRRRDEFLKSKGFKILRIKSKRKVPDKSELYYFVDKILSSKKNYFEIILPDWDKSEYKKEVSSEFMRFPK